MKKVFRGEQAAYTVEVPAGEAVVVCKGWTETNEDAVSVASRADGVLLAVADGIGGLPDGQRASAAALRALCRSFAKHESIESACETANRAVLRLRGPATTLTTAFVANGALITLHTGDSAALLVGGRGKIKAITTPHTVAGLGELSGLLGAEDARSHPQRHVLVRSLGERVLRLERTSWGNIALRDTLILGTDGLFDNLGLDEIGAIMCGRNLAESTAELARRARENMASGRVETKPDDLAVVTFRRIRS